MHSHFEGTIVALFNSRPVSAERQVRSPKLEIRREAREIKPNELTLLCSVGLEIECVEKFGDEISAFRWLEPATS